MCHVLIIEDEPIIALDLEGLLEREGATSFAFAVSENEAVTAAGLQRPDIITSNVTLVEGTVLPPSQRSERRLVRFRSSISARWHASAARRTA